MISDEEKDQELSRAAQSPLYLHFITSVQERIKGSVHEVDHVGLAGQGLARGLRPA